MSVISCCGIKQKTHAYVCDPPEGYVFQQIDFLVLCKHCKSTVMQVTRLDCQNRVTYFRRTEWAARELFERMRPSIRYKIPKNHVIVNRFSSFSLPYNEFGRVKKCYSNFSSLLDVGESLDLPKSTRILLKKTALSSQASVIASPQGG